MEIQIDEHSMKLQYGTHLYVRDNGTDDGDIRISAVSSGCSLNVDMSIDELQRFRDLLNNAIQNAFDVQPEIQCPACGYTREQAQIHGDHRHCRRYPFFPGEKGKSHAIEK